MCHDFYVLSSMLFSFPRHVNFVHEWSLTELMKLSRDHALTWGNMRDFMLTVQRVAYKTKT
jgi:hypothetical protein